MQILTYPIGVVVGLLPVAVDLGPQSERAQLLLDSRPACEMSQQSRRCDIDLGPEPRIHLFELVRRDENGEIRDRVRRWINLPGAAEAEAHVTVACGKPAGACTLTPSWAHPTGGQARDVRISVGEVQAFHGAPQLLSGPLTVPRGPSAPPALVTMEVEFTDGHRAAFATIIGARYTEESATSLQAFPIATGKHPIPDRDLVETLSRASNAPVRSVGKGQSELTVIVEPSAVVANTKVWQDLAAVAAAGGTIAVPQVPAGVNWTGSTAPGSGSGARFVSDVESVDFFHVAVANEQLSVFDAFGFAAGKHGWLRALVEGPAQLPGGTPRTADAVAAGAYAGGATWRRRAVVLILGETGPATPAGRDASRFSPAAARAYLREIMVPLFVWRLGNDERPEWGESRLIRSGHDFERAMADVRAELDGQRIAWIEGERHPASIDPRLPGGARLAGRSGEP